MNDYIHIGKIAATHGLKGELLLKHVLGKKTVFKQAEVLFIEIEKNIQLPYFIESSNSKNITETILKFEGVDTREVALKFLQKKIWLTKKDFENLVSKKAAVNLIGFAVIDNHKKIGEIDAVIEQPHQTLLQLTVNKKEVFVPLHEKTLKKINRAKKEVHVLLPEGLLEVYLGD